MPKTVWADSNLGPAVSAQAAVLIDVDSGQILYSKNSQDQRPMASTTKVMTALLAISSAELDSVVKVSPRAARVGESSMYLKEGETLALQQVIYGALLPSGNDACVAIAEHTAGSEEAFVLLMNEKAALMGTGYTSFRNTNGLPAKGHYSTALDMALISRNALHNPVFCRIVKTRYKIIEAPGGMNHYLKNTNKLLWRYPGANGVKTGTTIEAGKCLIASATNDNRRLVAVILNGPNRFEDASRLLDYGFKNFKSMNAVYAGEVCSQVRVIDGVNEKIPAKTIDNVIINVQSDGSDKVEKKVKLIRSIKAPVREGQLLGEVIVCVNGMEIGSSNIVAACSAKKLSIIQKVTNKMVELF